MTAFLLLRLAPGKPFSYVSGNVTPAVQAHWRAAFGYDRPIPEQFVRYFSNIVRGELGYSTNQLRPAREAIGDAFPRTLTLAVLGLLFGIPLGLALGLASAARHRSAVDRAISLFSVILYSIPDFWLALIIQMTLGYAFGWFPISQMADPTIADYGTPWQVIGDRLNHLVMPVLTLALLIGVILARFQRAALLDVLPSDYLRTARAKGASERIVMRHALRNALTPTVTMLGMMMPAVLGGVFFIEYVFDWHGLGWLTVTSLQALDYDVATASVIISGVFVAIGSLSADLLAAWLDPRVNHA